MAVPLRSNRHVAFACTDHVVWCPKYRRPVLDPAVQVRLTAILREVAREREAQILELAVVPDHVHLLVSVDPQYGIHRLVRRMKGRSSRLLRAEFPALRSRLPTLWTTSDFVATVGGASLAVVRQDLERQNRV